MIGFQGRNVLLTPHCLHENFGEATILLLRLKQYQMREATAIAFPEEGPLASYFGMPRDTSKVLDKRILS